MRINGGPVRQLYIPRLVPTWVLFSVSPSVCVCFCVSRYVCGFANCCCCCFCPGLGDEGCSSPALVVVVYVLGTCAYGPHISIYIRRRRQLTRTSIFYSANVSTPRSPVLLCCGWSFAEKAHPPRLSLIHHPPTIDEATNPSTSSGHVAENNIFQERESLIIIFLHLAVPRKHPGKEMEGTKEDGEMSPH